MTAKAYVLFDAVYTYFFSASTVSYTHLDVYKRQELVRSISSAEPAVAGVSEARSRSACWMSGVATGNPHEAQNFASSSSFVPHFGQ